MDEFLKFPLCGFPVYGYPCDYVLIRKSEIAAVYPRASTVTVVELSSGKTYATSVSLDKALEILGRQTGCWNPILESKITGYNPELSGDDPIGGYSCSVCGFEAILDCNDKYVLSKYCPNCGALMVRG